MEKGGLALTAMHISIPSIDSSFLEWIPALATMMSRRDSSSRNVRAAASAPAILCSFNSRKTRLPFPLNTLLISRMDSSAFPRDCAAMYTFAPARARARDV